MTAPALSVVIPAYNEQLALPLTVAAVRDHLDARGETYEVIVVDNASEDATVAVLEPLLDGERVRLVRNDRNRGKGYSVRRGMLAARGDLVLHCDADCAASLESLPRMREAIAEADMVAGSRLAPGARLDRRQPFRRRVVGRSFVLLCRALLREPTTDLFCGFKLFRADAARDVFSRSTLEGWTYDAEVLALARALGYRVREVGVVWSDRDGSRLSMARVLVPVVRELLQARRHVRREAALGAGAGREPIPAQTESRP